MTTPDQKSETGVALTRAQTSLVLASRMSTAIGDVARRMRFSTRVHRVGFAGGFRARRGERLFRLGVVLSFILLVVIPGAVAAVYFALIASPQYYSEIRFTLGGGEIAFGGKSAFRGLPLPIVVQDTEIVQKYLQSPAIVEELGRMTNLRGIYDNSRIDWFSRLRGNASMEQLNRYWRSMTSSDIKMPGGIIVFKVWAFSPKDAATLAGAALTLSERTVNQLNERMIRDAMSRASDELKGAATRLSQARIALEKARDTEGMLSADSAANAINELLKGVEAGKIALQQEYDSRLRFVGASEPEMRTLRSQIRAADLQIADLKSRLTVTAQTGKDTVITASMVKLDTLELDRQIAQMQYAMATGAFQQARIIANSQLIYLNSFVTPTLGQLPGFPTSFEEIVMALIALLAGWGLLVTAATFVRNYMA